MKRKSYKILLLLLLLLLIIPIKTMAREIENQIEIVLKTDNFYNESGNLILSVTTESTELEALSYTPSRDTDCGDGHIGYQACHETTYKFLGLGTLREGTKYCLQVSLFWYQVPLITKYDDIAIRWTNTSSSITTIKGEQQAIKNGNIVQTNYYSNNSLVQTFSNGAGITMNMYDNANSHNMYLYADLNGNPGTLYATYQHARNSNITQSLAMNYSISSLGLGNVLYFNNATTRGYFDGMQGVSVNSYPIGICGTIE